MQLLNVIRDANLVNKLSY